MELGQLSYLHTSYHLEPNYSTRQVSLVAALTWFSFLLIHAAIWPLIGSIN